MAILISLRPSATLRAVQEPNTREKNRCSRIYTRCQLKGSLGCRIPSIADAAATHLVVQFESLLSRCNGSKHRLSIDTVLNIGGCTKLITQHFLRPRHLQRTIIWFGGFLKRWMLCIFTATVTSAMLLRHIVQQSPALPDPLEA